MATAPAAMLLRMTPTRGERRPGTGEVDEAAERRPDDGRGLARRGAPGHRLAELLARNEKRRERLLGGPGKRTRRSGESKHRVEGPGVDRPRDDEIKKKRGAGGLDDVRGAEDAAPVGAVGHIAARQRKEGDGKKDGQRSVAERERIAGHVVQVPADRHRLHLHREAGEEPAAEKKAEVAPSQGRARRGERRIYYEFGL